MGIPRPIARLLIEEARRRPFSGSLLELGRCYVYLTWDELSGWAARDGLRLAEVAVELSHDPRLAAAGCISDRTFFGALGFERVESLDLLPDESPTHVHDLNLPLPAGLEGRFDVVFDTGTLIHVFDQRAAWANVGRALGVDGRAIHNVPSTNHVDVGLYMHSPQLFADYYAANGWRIETLRFCEFEPLWFRGRFVPPLWRAYDYRPGALDGLGLGGWGARPAATWAVATKVAGATVDRVPLQGAARAGTPVPAASSAGAAPPAAPENSTTPASGGADTTSSALDPLLLGAKRLWRGASRALRRPRPPLVGRY